MSSAQVRKNSASASSGTTSTSSANNQQTTQRLQQELMAIMSSQDDTCSAFPSGDSLYHWVGTIKGAADTPYEGLTFRLTLQFGAEYPFKAPIVKFDTPCYHPNVDMHGNICLDILKVRSLKSLALRLALRLTLVPFEHHQEKWSAAFSVKSILQSIQSLLGDANCDSPLNTAAARLWELGHMSADYRDQVVKMHGGRS